MTAKDHSQGRGSENGLSGTAANEDLHPTYDFHSPGTYLRNDGSACSDLWPPLGDPNPSLESEAELGLTLRSLSADSSTPPNAEEEARGEIPPPAGRGGKPAAAAAAAAAMGLTADPMAVKLPPPPWAQDAEEELGLSSARCNVPCRARENWRMTTRSPEP